MGIGVIHVLHAYAGYKMLSYPTVYTSIDGHRPMGRMVRIRWSLVGTAE